MNTTAAAHIDHRERNVGIDIGKSMLDIWIFEPDVYLQYPNNPEGIRESLKNLSGYNLTRILVEATGGYERGLVEACAEKELPIIINSLCIKVAAVQCKHCLQVNYIASAKSGHFLKSPSPYNRIDLGVF